MVRCWTAYLKDKLGEYSPYQPSLLVIQTTQTIILNFQMQFYINHEAYAYQNASKIHKTIIIN